MVIDVSLESRQKYLHYALIFWMIQLIKSNFFAAVGIDRMYILTIVIALFLLIAYRQRVPLYKSHTLWFIALATCGILGMVSTSGALTLGTILNTLGKILFVYVVIVFDSRNFVKRFVHLAYVMSVCSILCWLIYVVLGSSVAQMICNFLYHGGPNQYGLFLIGYDFSQHGIIGLRNTYMYAEPGVHQMIPNTALIFTLFYGDRVSEKRIRYVLAFIINILTIQSTEGYMILISTLLIAVLQSERLQSTGFKNIRYILLTIFAGAYFYVVNFVTEGSFLYRNFYIKIFNESNQIDFTRGTASARTDSLLKVESFFNADISTILFGAGSATSGVSTSSFSGINGIFVLVAYFGMIFAVIFYGYCLYQLIKNRNNILFVFAVIFAIICHGMSQPDFMNVLCVSMLLYGSIYNIEKYNWEESYELD